VTVVALKGSSFPVAAGVVAGAGVEGVAGVAAGVVAGLAGVVAGAAGAQPVTTSMIAMVRANSTFAIVDLDILISLLIIFITCR